VLLVGFVVAGFDAAIGVEVTGVVYLLVAGFELLVGAVVVAACLLDPDILPLLLEVVLAGA